MEITSEEYRENPCGMLSIPYWKNKKILIPNNMRILHQKDFNESYLNDYSDEPYFRLFHSLQNFEESMPDWIYFKTAKIEDMSLIVSIINQSYTDISVDVSQMMEYTKTVVYDKDLWVIAFDKKTDAPIGCGIADFDQEMKEGILEWIQVLPEYRKKNVGSAIVNQLLYRLSSKAEFATVSGKENSPSNPERLYRKCGFTGNDVWHILRMKTGSNETLALEKVSANMFNVICNGNAIGKIEMYSNTFHEQNQYLRLHLSEYNHLWASRLFSLLQDRIRKPLQIMLSSENIEQRDFLLAGGFQCRRKCYEMEVSQNDLVTSINAEPLNTARIGSPEYIICSQLMYDYYKSTHAKINPLTADFVTFCDVLPADVFFQKNEGEIKHFAFVLENEIAYIGSTDVSSVEVFVESVASALFDKFETIVFEADDCDAVAMTLRQLFSTQTEESFDTYNKI